MILKHRAAVVGLGRAPEVEAVEVAAVRAEAQATARPMGSARATGIDEGPSPISDVTFIADLFLVP